MFEPYPRTVRLAREVGAEIPPVPRVVATTRAHPLESLLGVLALLWSELKALAATPPRPPF